MGVLFKHKNNVMERYPLDYNYGEQILHSCFDIVGDDFFPLNYPFLLLLSVILAVRS